MDRDYVLNYIVNTSQALAPLHALKSEIHGLAAEAQVSTIAVDLFTAQLAKTAPAAFAAGSEVHALTRQAGYLGNDAARAGVALDALNAKMAVAAGTASALNLGMVNAGQGASAMGGEIGGLVPKFMLFQLGVEMATQFGESINRAREYLKEMGLEASETRDRMREVANLKGHSGPDDEIVSSTILMGMKAGMTPQEANQFMEQFEGSAPAGRVKGPGGTSNITPDVERGLAQEGMKFASRVALQPKTGGDLAGVLSQYGKIDSVEQGAGKMGAIAEALNEGRGNLEPLMRSLIKTAGDTVEEHGGPVEDLEQLAAMLGVASLNATPDRAGTRIKNMVAGLRHFKQDEEGRPADAQARTLERLGITPRMKTSEALAIISRPILAADADGTGGDTYMLQAGFNNKDEARAIVQGARNIAVVGQRLARARAGNQGPETVRKNEEFLRRDEAGLNRRVVAEEKAQEYLIGQPQEGAVRARRAGGIASRAEGHVGMAHKNFMWALDAIALQPWTGVKPAQQNVDEEAFMGQLHDQMVKLGMDPRHEAAAELRREGDDFNAGAMTDDRQSPRDTGARNFFRRSFDADGGTFRQRVTRRVIDAGGDAYGDQSETARKLRRLGNEDKHRREQPTPGPRAPGPLGMGGPTGLRGALAATAMGALGEHTARPALPGWAAAHHAAINHPGRVEPQHADEWAENHLKGMRGHDGGHEQWAANTLRGIRGGDAHARHAASRAAIDRQKARDTARNDRAEMERHGISAAHDADATSRQRRNLTRAGIAFNPTGAPSLTGTNAPGGAGGAGGAGAMRRQLDRLIAATVQTNEILARRNGAGPLPAGAGAVLPGRK